MTSLISLLINLRSKYWNSQIFQSRTQFLLIQVNGNWCLCETVACTHKSQVFIILIETSLTTLTEYFMVCLIASQKTTELRPQACEVRTHPAWFLRLVRPQTLHVEQPTQSCSRIPCDPCNDTAHTALESIFPHANQSKLNSVYVKNAMLVNHIPMKEVQSLNQNFGWTIKEETKCIAKNFYSAKVKSELTNPRSCF